jgi:hypothetical protein
MANEEKWISKQKAARRLDVCAKTIDRLRLRGELNSIRLGEGQTARVRIEVASIEAYEGRQSGNAFQPKPKERGLPIPALDKLRASKAARRASGRRPARWRRAAPVRISSIARAIASSESSMPPMSSIRPVLPGSPGGGRHLWTSR